MPVFLNGHFCWLSCSNLNLSGELKFLRNGFFKGIRNISRIIVYRRQTPQAGVPGEYMLVAIVLYPVSCFCIEFKRCCRDRVRNTVQYNFKSLI